MFVNGNGLETVLRRHDVKVRFFEDHLEVLQRYGLILNKEYRVFSLRGHKSLKTRRIDKGPCSYQASRGQSSNFLTILGKGPDPARAQPLPFPIRPHPTDRQNDSYQQRYRDVVKAERGEIISTQAGHARS
jgi:hypothetical protein